jgi:hypothetical protein
LATSKETKQSKGWNEEKRIQGLRVVEPSVNQTRGVTPWIRVGKTVIGLRYIENTNGCRLWLATALMLVNYGKTSTGRNSRRIYSDYRKECSKQFRLATSVKLGHFKN